MVPVEEWAADYLHASRLDAVCPDRKAARVDSVPVLAAAAERAASGHRASTCPGCCVRRHNAPDARATTAALASHSRPSSTHDGLGRQCAASPPAC